MRKLSTRDRLTSWLLRNLLRLLSATWRYREEAENGSLPILEGREPAVIAFLHGKMLPMWYRFRGGAFAALVSTSRDGQLLADYLEGSLDYRDVVRGSSSKGGRAAFGAMVRLLKEEGRPLLVTPDGPRGPAGIPKRGSLLAAEMAERRVLVATWHARHVIRLKSWDAMEIPYPFSEIKCRYCTLNESSNETLSHNENTSTPPPMERDGRLEHFQELLNS